MSPDSPSLNQAEKPTTGADLHVLAGIALTRLGDVFARLAGDSRRRLGPITTWLVWCGLLPRSGRTALRSK